MLDLDRILPRSILEARGDAVVATDRDGRIVFWNPGASRIFGFEPAQALGQSLDLIIPENLRARHWQGYGTVIATGKSHYGEGDVLSVPALTKDGRRISVEFTVQVLHDQEGRIVGLAALMRDVTKRFDELKALRRRLAELEAAKSG